MGLSIYILLKEGLLINLYLGDVDALEDDSKLFIFEYCYVISKVKYLKELE